MSNFFNQEQLNSITLNDINTESVKDFSSADLNTPLGDLPRYEDLYKKEIPSINIEDLAKYNQSTVNSVQEREFKKKVDKEKMLLRARVKLFLTMFTLITLIITGFVIYNLVAISRLNNEIDNNSVKIKSKQEQIVREMPMNLDKELDISKGVEIVVKI